jgi:hypothetical protein
VRRVSFAHSALVVVTLAALSAAPLRAQSPGKPLTKDEITSFAKLEVAISYARDSAQAQLAMARNKTVTAQQALRDKLRNQIDAILHQAGLTEPEYEKKIYLVSTDSSARRTFDQVVAQLSGVPTPGQVLALATANPQTKVPAGPVGTHLGHVLNSFGDTPMEGGLLPTALTEAKTAATHAALGARDPANLAAMKLHAGHVINAIDPTIVAAGPGLGYGVKRAALNIATHMDLAAKSQGASPNVITHANHVSTAARSVAARSDQAIAIAKQVQAAGTAAEAAGLMSQLVSITSQLTAGFDANGDGKITWQDPEGGLQQAQEHINLLLAGEGIAP